MGTNTALSFAQIGDPATQIGRLFLVAQRGNLGVHRYYCHLEQVFPGSLGFRCWGIFSYSSLFSNGARFQAMVYGAHYCR